VPNEYSVWLSSADRERYEGVEHEVIDELCAYLLEHARREDLIMASPPAIAFHTDERLSLGEFGIQARLVRPTEDEHERRDERERHDQPAAPYAPQPPVAQEQHGQTMIYSTSERLGRPVQDAHARRPPERALLAVGGRRLIVPPGGGTIGRSRDCDVVLEDAGISRQHAELRPGPDGWTVADLGSTNGVRVNGVQLLQSGDRVELGSTEIVFELA
jgi:FHA domain/Protein of unknown function (DUF3662)